MSALKDAWKIENLELAWNWIRSNPDRAYKSYFREIYSAYSVADKKFLEVLRSKLNRGIYSPSNSDKIYLPKPSGILRPYSLLDIEDQIVYQSLANIIAEKFHSKFSKRYNKQVFGHQYAGKSSTWFYKKWSDGYGAFNNSVKNAFDKGYVWGADFDLTAFYDSIDHEVLSQILLKNKFDKEFCDFLTSLLSQWTATSTKIFHNHGIPQGPLSSGIVSEIVLSYFDENFKSKDNVKYFRYVDDIKLFAKSELHLRHALTLLDRLSKDIGLFPQSEKINIHHIVNIDDEIKHISNPFEFFLKTTKATQKEIQAEIAEIAPSDKGYKVSNPTRFKYLLSNAEPSLRLLNRVLSILEKSPDYYLSISNYISKFKKIPEKQAKEIMRQITTHDLYPVVQASIISACNKNLVASNQRELRKILKPLWKVNINSMELTLSLWPCLHKLNHLTQNQINYGLNNSKPQWLRAQLLETMPTESLTNNQLEALINSSIRSESDIVALMAGWTSLRHNIEIKKPIKGINSTAKILLQESGRIPKSRIRICGIKNSLDEIANINLKINWQRFFKKEYRLSEAKVITARGYFKTNATAFVNAIDVFNDLLLDALFQKDPSLGKKNEGNFGAVLHNKTLSKNYPKIYKYVIKCHDLRLQSELSHAKVKTTKKPTKRIPFKTLKTVQILLKDAMTELSQHY
jgi:hypothetical protein